MQVKRRFEIWTVLSWAILALFLLFFVYPMCSLLWESVYVEGEGFTLKAFSEFFAKEHYYGTIFNSFKVSLAVMLVSLVLGVPFSYFYTFYDLKGRRALFVLCLLCTMSAPFIGAYAWILMLGRSGFISVFLRSIGIDIGSIYGFGGILLVQSLKLFPLVVIYMNGAFKNIDNSLMEVSESLGCKGVKRLMRVVLALSMPTILAAALLVFMRAFADFGTPALIGEGYTTFPVLIYQNFLSETGSDYNFASAVSVIAIVLTGAVFLFQKFVTRKVSFPIYSVNPISRKKPRGAAGALMHTYCYGLIALALLPQIYVIYMSFRNFRAGMMQDGYSFGNYEMAADRYFLSRAVGNTLITSVLALAVILVLAVIIAYVVVRRRNPLNNTIDTISMLPYIMPGAVIGISLITSFNKPGLNLMGTIWIMIIALAIRRMPFTSRSAAATMAQIPITTEEAALSLGASKLKTFVMVTVPMMSNGIVAGAVLSFVSIITEMSSGVMLYNNRTITLTLSTYSAIVRGNDGVAAAFATITTVFTIACLVLYLVASRNESDVKL